MTKLRILTCLFIILVLALIPGCWDREEINQLAIVRTIAIDYLPGRRAPFLVTVNVIRPIGSSGSDSGGGAGPTRLYMGTGASIDLALQQAGFAMSRRIFLSHNQIILVGEVLAQHGMHIVTDFTVHNQEMRLTNLVLVVPGLAHDILQVQERMEGSVADEIQGLLDQARKTSEAEPRQSYQILRDFSTPGKEAYAPVIRTSPSMEQAIPKLQDAQQQQAESNSNDRQTRLPPEVMHLAGTAVFGGDKLAGYLNHIETRGFLWLTGGSTRGVITLTDPLHPEHLVNTSVSRSSVTLTPQVSGDSISFRVEVMEEGDIISQSSMADLSTPEMIRLLNSAKAAAIKVEIEKALDRLQEMGTDIVGFGASLRRSDYQAWQKVEKQWPEVFRNLDIDVHVTANIRRTGMLSRPVRVTR